MGASKSFRPDNTGIAQSHHGPGSPGELSDEVFTLFSDLIYGTSGIKLAVNKKGLLVSRLSKRLKKNDAKTFLEYYHTVKEDNEELIHMLNCVATNITKFFRENYHFEYLKNTVVPMLIRAGGEGKSMRIWSAGCSTGEEPHSIAIAVCEALRNNLINPESWDIRILATDISTKVLESAESGVYEHEQLPDDISADLVGRYFLKGTGENEGKVKVKDPIRNIVRFRRLNLKDDTYPFRKDFDVIFCRNVMIYFDDTMRRHVISKFHQHLAANGHLFLGHSETMFGRGHFIPVHVTVYKKS